MRFLPGIVDVQVNLAARTLAVEREEGSSPPDVPGAVRRAGYGAIPVAPLPASSAGEQRQEPEVVWLQIRLAVAIFFGMSAMLPSIVVYLGAVDAAEARVHWALAAASGALSVPVVFFSGWPFLTRALSSVRRLAPGMDLLVASGALATFVYSVVVLARGSSAVYFDTAAGIVTFLLIGRLLESLARKRSLNAVDLLHALSPSAAHLLQVDGGVTDVETESVATGARILVRPGERVPLDGRVVSGTSHLDRSLLTGESMPVSVGEGDAVEAGTLNQRGALILDVTRAVGERALDRIAGMVDELLARRAPMQALADRVAARLTLVALIVAVLTGIALLLWGRGVELALLRSVSILVIACPCALGLATPMAVLVAAGRAARRGILFRDAATIERTADVTAVLLDKTGTLTQGRPAVVDVLPQGAWSAEDVLASAAIAESGSEHPIARAVVARMAPKYEHGEAHVIPGGGVVWRAETGRTIRVGTGAFLEAEGVSGVREPARCSTVAHVAVDEEWLGTIVVADPVRPEAAAAITDLRALGVRVALVSGDSDAPTQDVAARVGITEVSSACSPDDKAEYVAAARRTGDVVAFVGDGLNDGPALAAADVGIAVSGATDVASAAAGVTLRAGGVERLVEALELARATRRTMRQNLGWAIGYNAVAIPFAGAGLVPPSFAALAMAASSLSVIANSMRLARGRHVRTSSAPRRVASQPNHPAPP